MFIHEAMRHHFEGFPPSAPPMAILSAMVNTVGCFEPEFTRPDDTEGFLQAAVRLISKVRTIAAASYKKSIGDPIIYPRYDLSYTANFLHMMFCKPNRICRPDPAVERALDQIFILHADHEQNCSTSTVRLVGSSDANLYASIAAGINALWGPLHGGANQAAIEMLEWIRDNGANVNEAVRRAKDKNDSFRLSGFGHRVYKNYDPRARILKATAERVLSELQSKDVLFDLALELEQVALTDDYFIEHKLYPNVDFYSGLIYRAMGFPSNMFPVLFAIGRLPGWIAHWKEGHENAKTKIGRPRQIYTGPTERKYVPIDER